MKFGTRLVHSELSEVALSQAIFAATQIYIPWLAASRAPVADLAMLALAQSLVWPMAMVAQMQLRTIYVIQAQQRLLPLFVQLRLGACVLLVVCAALASVLLQRSELLLALTVVLAVMKCVENLADIMQGELQRAMAIGRAARSQTIRCAIFIGVYTACLVASARLVFSLVAAVAGMAAWVAAVDLRPRRIWREVFGRVRDFERVTATFKAGLCLSAAIALTSLSMMVGRWAAMRAGDTRALAACALAGTVASAVAVVLGATLQFSITHARAQFDSGGLRAFRAWTSKAIARRLHLGFGALALAWVIGAVLAYDFTLPLPGRHADRGMQDTVVMLSGCFLVGGWLSVLCFPDTMLLYLLQRHRTILLIGIVQVVAAAGASLVLYPFIGWPAIGVAELVRGSCFVLAVRYSNARLVSSGPLRLSRVAEEQ
jgi:hypothetical protein